MSTIYTVKAGDTLSKIARTHGLGSWRELYSAPENEGFRRRRPNPDRIFPGDQLFVPGGGCTIEPPAQTDASFKVGRQRPIVRPLRKIEEGRDSNGNAAVWCHSWPSQFEWREDVTINGRPNGTWQVGFIQNVARSRVEYVYAAPFEKIGRSAPRTAREVLPKTPILDGKRRDLGDDASSAGNIWFMGKAWTLGRMSTGIPPGLPALPSEAYVEDASVRVEDDPGPNRPLFHPDDQSKRLSAIHIDQEFHIWLAAKPLGAPNSVASSYIWLRHAIWTIKRTIGISPYGFAYTINPNSVAVKVSGDGKGSGTPVLTPPFAGEASRFEP